MAEVEPVVEPDSVGNDVWGKSVPFVGVHGLIPAQIRELTWQYLSVSTF